MSKSRIFGCVSTIFGFLFLIVALLSIYGIGAAVSTAIPLTGFGLAAISCGVVLLSVRDRETKEITDLTQPEPQTAPIIQERETIKEAVHVPQVERMSAQWQEQQTATVPPQPEIRKPNTPFNYMLFVLGMLLLIGGLYLATYTTVVIVNKPMSIFGYTYNVPTAVQIQPYAAIGVLVILLAVGSIGWALYSAKSRTL